MNMLYVTIEGEKWLFEYEDGVVEAAPLISLVGDRFVNWNVNKMLRKTKLVWKKLDKKDEVC